MSPTEQVRAIWTCYHEASCEADRMDVLEEFATFQGEMVAALEDAVADMLRAQREEAP